MKKNKILFMLFIFFFYSFSQALSQNSPQTPYQKKKLELAIKWYKILSGKPVSMLNEVLLNQQLQSDEDQGLLLSLVALDYASKHSKSQCDKVLAQINIEFKQAEKLKTSVDFQREKEAKNKKEREEREAKNKKEKEERDAKNIKEQEEREAKLIKEQEEKEEFLRDSIEKIEKTDIVSIKKNITKLFLKWNQKGEFEKEDDYVKRQKTQSQKTFDEICFNQIQNKINSLNKGYWRKDLSTYDSEGEFFIVSFKINGVEWNSKINIPIAQAPNFKGNWYNLSLEIDYYNWCFVENSLCPTSVTLLNHREANSKYEIPLSLKNQYEISYSFDNLEIDNQFLKGYIFKYSNAKTIVEQVEKEKQRLDSLVLATYNQKLDSIINFYNLQLLKNPYNINQIVMTDCKKVTGNSDRERSFNTIESSLKQNFVELNRNFGKELKSTNPSEYFRIYYEQNPQEKVLADKKYLECKCSFLNRISFDIQFQSGIEGHCFCRSDEYNNNRYLFTNKEEFDSFYDKGDEIYKQEIEKRSSLNYLSENTKIIESLDFQNIKKESDDNTIRKISTIINDSKNKSYYLQVLDFIIEKNKGLKKEWSKKGELFSTKIEFFEAYTSSDYKKILKEKKK